MTKKTASGKSIDDDIVALKLAAALEKLLVERTSPQAEGNDSQRLTCTRSSSRSFYYISFTPRAYRAFSEHKFGPPKEKRLVAQYRVSRAD
jgi:hypothetical protein